MESPVNFKLGNRGLIHLQSRVWLRDYPMGQSAPLGAEAGLSGVLIM